MCRKETSSLRGPVQTISTDWSASRDLRTGCGSQGDGDLSTVKTGADASPGRSPGKGSGSEGGGWNQRFGIGLRTIHGRDDLSHLLDDIPRKLAGELQGGFESSWTGSWHSPINTQKPQAPSDPGRGRTRSHSGPRWAPGPCDPGTCCPVRRRSRAQTDRRGTTPRGACALLARMVLGAERVAGAESHASIA